MTTTTRPNLTPTQQRVFDLICAYLRNHDTAPTLDYLARELDVSKATTHGHLCELQGKGYIHRNKHKARSIQLVDGDGWVSINVQRPGKNCMVEVMGEAAYRGAYFDVLKVTHWRPEPPRGNG